MFPEAKDGTVATRLLLPALQRPFLDITAQSSLNNNPPPPTSVLQLTPSQAIRTLQNLLTNTDPSPALISNLLTPIVPSLYELSSALDLVKTSDPALKTTVRGFLRTWGRLVDTIEGIATLWLVVDGEGGQWQVNIVGEIARIERLVLTSSYHMGRD